MSHTVTVRLPSLAQVVRVVVGAIVVIVVIGLGLLAWSQLNPASEPRSFAQAGRLQEITLVNGTVVVGQLKDDAGGYLRVSGAAEVSAGTGDQAGAMVVKMIATDPTDADGEVLISVSQVVTIMNVLPGSGLETAYRQASGELPQPTTSPPPPSGSAP
jgi:hypothetical protein